MSSENQGLSFTEETKSPYRLSQYLLQSIDAVSENRKHASKTIKLDKYLSKKAILHSLSIYYYMSYKMIKHKK